MKLKRKPKTFEGRCIACNEQFEIKTAKDFNLVETLAYDCVYCGKRSTVVFKEKPELLNG